MFVDKVDIFVTAGRGGDGCSSFRREKYVPRGGPDGGTGGRGGSVILVADAQMGTLLNLSRNQHIRATAGRQGGPKNMTGRSGEDCEVRVPVGTLVRSFIDEGVGVVLGDLTRDGQRFVAAKGGRGGRGNSCFATSVNQAPRRWERGETGEEHRLTLELKLIADVGLVGLPNAGKSTLLGKVSAARPKTASYPFTTLVPVPGIVQLGDFETCVMADIPGLIEGAHEGVGLGMEFLRHIERTRILVHVIDSAPVEGDLISHYRQIRAELEAYGAGLADKHELIALNKMDIPEAQDGLESFQAAFPDAQLFAICALTGKGLAPLLSAIAGTLKSLAPVDAP